MCRIIRQFLALYFAAYADATEIYVGKKRGSDMVFNCYCKNLANLVILWGKEAEEVFVRDEPRI